MEIHMEHKYNTITGNYHWCNNISSKWEEDETDEEEAAAGAMAAAAAAERRVAE